MAEPKIYQIEQYEHLRKKSKWQPNPLIITGVFPSDDEPLMPSDNSSVTAKHPHLDLNLDDVLRF